jgi:hypothetical protein
MEELFKNLKAVLFGIIALLLITILLSMASGVVEQIINNYLSSGDVRNILIPLVILISFSFACLIVVILSDKFTFFTVLLFSLMSIGLGLLMDKFYSDDLMTPTWIWATEILIAFVIGLFGRKALSNKI